MRIKLCAFYIDSQLNNNSVVTSPSCITAYCTGMRIGAEVRNQHAFIYFYLLNFICILSQNYNFDFNI